MSRRRDITLQAQERHLALIMRPNSDFPKSPTAAVVIEHIRTNVKEVEGGCKEWADAVRKNNSQPRIKWRGVDFNVRRLLLVLLGHPVGGKTIWAKCGNTRCVAEEHLRFGTFRQACASAAKNGKYESGALKTITALKKASKTAKLSSLKYAEVMAKVDQGMTHGQIAEEYGVTRQWVSELISRAVVVNLHAKGL